jgi:hypothetical protein
MGFVDSRAWLERTQEGGWGHKGRMLGGGKERVKERKKETSTEW